MIIRKFLSFYKSAYTMGHFPSLFELLYTKKKIFAYYGYLGDKNFGDELVYESAKSILEPNILVPVRKFMPIALRVFCFFFKNKFSGIVVGGGTLIGPFWEKNFFLSLIKLKKPIYVHGTGVHKEIDCINEWMKVFQGKFYGGVRGNLSKRNLMPVYPDIKIIGDGAFALYNSQFWNTNSQNKKSAKNILINLGTHFEYHGEKSSRDEFKKFIKYCIESGYNVKFLPFHSVDHELGDQLIQEFPEIILLKQPDNYLEAVDLFKDASFAIGERLHFVVMAILTKIPFISLNYGEKHEDLLMSVDLSPAGLQPGYFTNDTIVEHFENRYGFNWGQSENILNSFKAIQISEGTEFEFNK